MFFSMQNRASKSVKAKWNTLYICTYFFQDLPAIFFYLLIAIVMHQIIQEYLLDRVNRKLHLSKIKHTKFNESGKMTFFVIQGV